MAALVSQRTHLARLIRFGLALAFAVGLGLALSACQPSAPDSVTVLAASSLQDVVTPLLAHIEKEHGVSVRVAFAASSTLARQIQAGAPADIFLSADVAWMDELQREQRVSPKYRVENVGNELVLIGARPGLTALSPARLPAELNASTRLVLADPSHVPAGRYARAALERAGVWEAVVTNVVVADNVRGALALVERGEASYGVVYKTDVALAPRVSVLAQLPSSADAPVRYSFALLRKAPHPQARAVFDALTDAQALARFSAAGFVTL